MSEKAEKLKTDRRGFLKFAGLGAVAGGATLAAGEVASAETAVHPENSGYRETDHVRTFYDLARF